MPVFCYDGLRKEITFEHYFWSMIEDLVVIEKHRTNLHAFNLHFVGYSLTIVHFSQSSLSPGAICYRLYFPTITVFISTSTRAVPSKCFT